MTKGSWIHEDVTRHFGSFRSKASCAQCSAVNPEKIRVQQSENLRRTVPNAVFAAMCPTGRHIYKMYLSWIAEPDE